ncbi:40S Ribosomal Protein S3A [Manis pentadactyla]|nr:40S Ribosomal Protein S3A [Manis pentadactyla]
MVNPFSEKDWYDVKAPAMFNIRNIGKTLVTRTQGTKIASDGLKGPVFEVSIADMQNNEVAFRKFKLITVDVQRKNCLTNFHGMDLTHDKMCSMIQKWQIEIEAHVDVKTTNGYLLHLFCVGFTKNAIITFRRPLRLSVNSLNVSSSLVKSFALKPIVNMRMLTEYLPVTTVPLSKPGLLNLPAVQSSCSPSSAISQYLNMLAVHQD